MNFELWLFVIKRLGTTMDVTKAIYDRMTPDMQQRLRDEYDSEYGAGSKNVDGSGYKVRITVLKKECNSSLQKKYMINKNTGPCTFFEEGQVFVVDEESYSRCMDGKFCAGAWDAISKFIYSGLNGGSFRKGFKDDGVMIACCNDGTRPVIFKLERI